jgi:uncharacterized protein (DUF1015 family)
VPTKVRQIEADVRQRLKETVREQCVVGKFGEIDLMTDREVSRSVKKWTMYVLAHSKSMPDKTPRVHSFAVEDYEHGLIIQHQRSYDDLELSSPMKS